MTNRDADRWRQAKKSKRPIQGSIEFYIPIPTSDAKLRNEARQKIVKEINPYIKQLTDKIDEMRGIHKIYQHV